MRNWPIEYFDYHGELVVLEFLDHALGDEGVLCFVSGWLVDEDEDSLKIRYWQCGDMPDEDQNHEHLSIVKACLKSIHICDKKKIL